MTHLVNPHVLLPLPPHHHSHPESHCWCSRSGLIPVCPNTVVAFRCSPHHTVATVNSPSLSDNLNRSRLCLKLDSKWSCLTLMSQSCEVGHRPHITDNKAPKTPMRRLSQPCVQNTFPHRSGTGSDIWQAPVPAGLSSDGNPQSGLPSWLTFFS